MRILVDMPDNQVKELTRISAASKRPRAAIIRDAVSSYLAQHKQDPMRQAFGIWRDLKIDSVEYQRKLREEW
ncbi:MAG: ribbon-helix-helix protein, CopG family [Alphaproteobacteria bacterium]|nr:ribbon-helix-helix protein, CopG family [Alphaproteobacteria bacterium]MBV9062673.1 ribbon-helix-helix protein, CopG family [Alphaproteobacteria bacterium]